MVWQQPIKFSESKAEPEKKRIVRLFVCFQKKKWMRGKLVFVAQRIDLMDSVDLGIGRQEKKEEISHFEERNIFSALSGKSTL